MKLEEIKGFLHGGDYNAEQWLDRPEVLAEDLRLMKLAGVNVVTLGVFSWSCLEPEEGRFTFGWLDHLMDSLHENGIYVILATPSGSKPPWLARKYPEIMRTNEKRQRLLYGERHNHCNSSWRYREKVSIIDQQLAERYSHHPALIMWHVSNEMSGICHCESCQQEFRAWLKQKYRTIENLNHEYWSTFWSHTYNSWDELESPAPHGDHCLHGLALDYQRFYSDISIDFVRIERDILKAVNPQIPVTTNMFQLNCGINYSRLASVLDIISWDSYPRWHCVADQKTEWPVAVKAAFEFDFCRSLSGKPFYLMESVPSVPSQFQVCKLKRPGVALLSAIEAVACGADSVQYFQWRKSRGGAEKFHGAIVGHSGSGETRVFRDVSATGAKLKELWPIKGSRTGSQVALLYDWDNMRALELQKSLKNSKKDFEQQVLEHYEALAKQYVSIDVIDQNADFSQYQLITAPVMYLFKSGIQGKIKTFVENGGTFILTYYSGLVNENDLVFEGMIPDSLTQVFGLWAEEIDCLCDDEYNQISFENMSYQVHDYCELVHPAEAEVLAVYEHNFYQGMAAITSHSYGAGKACYIACRPEPEFLSDFYHKVINESGAAKIIASDYVKDVLVKERHDEACRYIFVMNFSSEEREITHQGKVYILRGYEWLVWEESVL